MIICGICALFCIIAIPVMNELKNSTAYLTINNIMYLSATVFWLLLLIFLYKVLKPITYIFILAGCVLLWGELYFIPLNISSVILLLSFGLSSVYALLCIVLVKKYKLLNALLPVVFYLGSIILKIIKLDKLIFFEGCFFNLFIYFGLICAVIFTILYIFLRKNRKDKNYIWLMLGLFIVSVVVCSFVPYVSLKYLNVAFQKEPVEIHNVEIIDKRLDKGAGTKSYKHYILTVFINNEEYELIFHPAVYEEYEIGDYIMLYEYDGLFDVKYLEYHWDELYKY
jgi:hypothetical protein